jgi:hypothetical protein
MQLYDIRNRKPIASGELLKVGTVIADADLVQTRFALRLSLSRLQQLIQLGRLAGDLP